MQGIGDQSQAQINQMIAQLFGGAASNLGSLGAGLLGQGQSAYGQQMIASQQRMENWANSILGRGVTEAVSTGEGVTLGA